MQLLAVRVYISLKLYTSFAKYHIERKTRYIVIFSAQKSRIQKKFEENTNYLVSLELITAAGGGTAIYYIHVCEGNVMPFPAVEKMTHNFSLEELLPRYIYIFREMFIYIAAQKSINRAVINRNSLARGITEFLESLYISRDKT